MNHNMKKRGLALLLACCCVFTAAPVAVKADNVSISTNQTPTGTYSSYTKAEVLKSDTVVYDTLSTSNNVHFYKYTAEKGGYFTVNLAQTSGTGRQRYTGGSDKSAERHLDQWKFLQSFGCGLV